MAWKDVQTPRPFVKVAGDGGVQDVLASAFGILAGRSDGNTLDQLLETTPTGRRVFVNDDCWWLYTDLQCHFHSLYGWRPFAGRDIRQADFSTWSAGFLDQVTEESREYLAAAFKLRNAPPVGWLPAQYSETDKHFMNKSPSMFYCNCVADEETWAFDEDPKYPGYHLFGHFGDHDLNPDYPLMNCISATDWMLWQRDAQAAKEYLPRIERFLSALEGKSDASGYFLFGPQGSQMEYGHAGWRRQSSTHLYYWKVLENVGEVYAMLGQDDASRRYRDAAEAAGERLRRFESPQGILVSGYSEDFSRTYGSGRMDGGESAYLEGWPNVNAAVLGWMSAERGRRLAERFEAVPAFSENHLTVSNYPERPADELDPDHDGFPPPGTHLNGGFFWMHGGSALWMYVRARHPQTLERLEELLEDHSRHLSVDYYNDWGRNKHEQFKDHPKETHSVTCAGAPGHFFRAAFGLTALANSLRIAPASLPQIERFEMLEPVSWGGKELMLAVSGEGTVRRVTLDGSEIAMESPDKVEIPFEKLADRAMLEVELG